MRLSSAAPALAVVALLVAGCCEEDPGLTVRGSVAVAFDGAETGFSFAEDTRLADDVLAGYDGPMAGHCTIDPQGPVDRAIVRPGEVEEGSRELRSFSATLEEGAELSSGQVEIELGTSVLAASGGAECNLELIYVNTDTGQVGLSAGCLAQSEDGESADLDAELHFRSCEVLEVEG